jgi:hypothetical protein
MEHLFKIWIESSKEPHSYEEPQAATHRSPSYHGYFARPPPLRTSSTYDDDDAFKNVAMNLLSRHEKLGLSANEAILATLIDSTQRSSFYQGLCFRLDRSCHLSPCTASLVLHLNETLGKKLKEMVVAECKGDLFCSNKLTTPQGISNCKSMKQKVQRRFFPDSDKGSITSPVRSGSGIFGSKRRIQNIDWKLAEAIQQVNHLSLDGPHQFSSSKSSGYEPPAQGM